MKKKKYKVTYTVSYVVKAKDEYEARILADEEFYDGIAQPLDMQFDINVEEVTNGRKACLRKVEVGSSGNTGNGGLQGKTRRLSGI